MASRTSPTAQRARPRVAATATSSTSPNRASPPNGSRSFPVSSAAPSRAAPIPGSSTAAPTRAHACPAPVTASITPASRATIATCIDRRSAEAGAGAGMGAGSEAGSEVGVGAEAGLWIPGAVPSGVGLPSRFGGPGNGRWGSGVPGVGGRGSATGVGGDRAGRVRDRAEGVWTRRNGQGLGGGDGGQQRAGLGFGLALLQLGDRVRHHPGAGLAVGHPVDEHARPDGDAGVQVPREVEVPDAPGVRPAPVPLQVVDDLHGPDLGRTRHRARREARRQHVEGRHPLRQLADHVRDQVHHVGVPLDPHELVHPDGPGAADPAEVVAGQVDQHHVLGPLLLVRLELGLQGEVGLRVGAAGTGAGDGSHGGPAALDGDQDLRRRAGDGDPGQAQEVHVRGGVDDPQDPVDVEGVGGGRHREPLGRHHLEDVAGGDVLLGHGDHLLVAAGGEVAGGGRGRAGGRQRGRRGRHRDRQPGGQGVDAPGGVGPGGLQVGGRGDDHVGHQHQPLAEVVEDDHRAGEDQHPLGQPEVVLGLVGQALQLPDEVVAEVADGPGEQRRQAGQGRRAQPPQGLAQHLQGRPVRQAGGRAAGPGGAAAADGQGGERVGADERVAAPALAVLDALQQYRAVLVAELAERPHRGLQVAEQLPPHRHHRMLPGQPRELLEPGPGAAGHAPPPSGWLKHDLVPLWHAGPICSTRTRSVSPSQSAVTERTCWTWPEVSPFCQYWPRERLQNQVRPLARVRRTASASIQATISTAPSPSSWTTAGTSPAASNFRPAMASSMLVVGGESGDGTIGSRVVGSDMGPCYRYRRNGRSAIVEGRRTSKGAVMSTQPEQAKAEILQQIVATIREKVPEDRRDQVEEFARQYYQRLAPEDLLELEPDDLYGAVLAHWRLAHRRRPGEAKVRVYSPRFEEHGWRSKHSIVEIVTDDMPFLVDSVAMDLNRHGLVIHLPIHPVIAVRRDAAGGLVEVLPPDAEDGLRESFLHFEVDRQSEPEVLDRLRAEVERVLGDVRAACDDWEAMREQVRKILEEFDKQPPPVDEAELAEARALLEWIDNHHFTFIGYRAYDLVNENGEDMLRPIPGTGLGILRQQTKPASGSFAKLPPEARRLARERHVLILTKANSHSTVHRPSYLDYIGVKRFDEHGEVIGERRFLGLYTSAASNRNPRDIPVLRRKVTKVLERVGLPRYSHDWKSLLNILETFPRDELFQISDDQLFETA